MERARLHRASPFYFLPMKSPAWLVLAIVFGLSLRLEAEPKEIIIATYNLENYLGAEPVADGGKSRGKPKTERAIEAVIRVVKEMNPDILGVCEMGSPERFEDFKKRLADAGLGYVDSEYVQAADPDRHLALVSRFPIVARQSQTDVPFELNGQPEKVRRGFLDVTIQVAPDYALRMVGVHLKSKLAITEGEAVVRRHEAQQLRRHVEKILTSDPQANLVCYGDFNDTKEQPMFAEIAGIRGTPTHLLDLPAKDDLGDKWTHYWKTADLYSRIDYLFVSPALVREVVPGSARVYRSEYWSDASDHRPVFATIVPVNKK
jgi:endonuclease/exonuclease/phosphatase family metal-dependent hydrolase